MNVCICHKIHCLLRNEPSIFLTNINKFSFIGIWRTRRSKYLRAYGGPAARRSRYLHAYMVHPPVQMSARIWCTRRSLPLDRWYLIRRLYYYKSNHVFSQMYVHTPTNDVPTKLKGRCSMKISLFYCQHLNSVWGPMNACCILNYVYCTSKRGTWNYYAVKTQVYEYYMRQSNSTFNRL